MRASTTRHPADSQNRSRRSSHRNPVPQLSTLNSQQSYLWDITNQLQENFQRVKSLLDSIDPDSDPHAKIKAAAEVRYHIALAQKTLEAASRVEAVRHFENTVLRILEQSGAAVRRRVIDKLNHRLKLLDQQAREAESESEQSPESVRNSRQRSPRIGGRVLGRGTASSA